METIGALYELSGIGRRKRKTKEQKKKKREERKDKIKKVFKKVAKVGLTPARLSFLAIVRINALKLATKLSRAYKTNPQKVKDFWSKFGGDWEKLKEVISKGSHVALSGTASRRYASYVGDPATLTAIATATPIILALLPILKELRANGDATEEKELQEGIDLGKTELLNSTDFEKVNVKTGENFESGKIEQDPEASTTELPTWVMPVALVGGGGLLLYVMTKK